MSQQFLTPSCDNSQPSSIYVISGKTLEKIRNYFISNNKEGKKGYLDIQSGHSSLFSDKYKENMNKVEKIIIETLKNKEKKRTDFCIFDAGAIEMSIMLSAIDKGIGSVAAYHTIKYPDILRKYMKIPDDEDIVMGIALGYEDKNNILSQIKTERMTLDEACNFYN